MGISAGSRHRTGQDRREIKRDNRNPRTAEHPCAERLHRHNRRSRMPKENRLEDRREKSRLHDRPQRQPADDARRNGNALRASRQFTIFNFQSSDSPPDLNTEN